jgi:hypothetical protein
MKLARTLATLCILGLAGNAFAGEIKYGAVPYEAQKITVNAEKVWLKKDKIWFKLLVINGTGKVLIFDKEQIQAKTPDGRIFARARSVFAAHAKPASVMPGMSAPLWVEYVIGEAPLQVSLLFKHGFILDGKPIELPDFVVNPEK